MRSLCEGRPRAQVVEMLRRLNWVMERGVEQAIDVEGSSLYDLLVVQSKIVGSMLGLRQNEKPRDEPVAVRC